MQLQETDVNSSLWLQKLLYFNAWYSFMFGCVHIAAAAYKLSVFHMPQETAIVLGVLTPVWIVLEVARLRWGYSANLRERVPEMAAFWLLTLFPQILIVGFLTFGQEALGSGIPLDLAVGIIPIVMMIAEIRISFVTLKALIRSQTAHFYRLCQEEALSASATRARAVATQPLLLIHALDKQRVTPATVAAQAVEYMSGMGGPRRSFASTQ